MASSATELSPRAHEIVGTARVLLEEEGLDALSMRRLAERLGIRAPSIYKHFADKRELEAALISVGFEELADSFEAAARRGGLRALCLAYRRFALAHPHLYRLMTSGPLPRDLLTPGVEDRAARPLLDALGGDADRARAAWAFAHGMAILELDSRFPLGADLDAAWRRGIAAFARRQRPQSGRL
jgi:AcrR family transcriptional regulator